MGETNRQYTMWFCYHTDFSGFAIFDNELDALRYAVEKSMECQQVINGDIKEQLK